jgi:excisionase family DNA binding protein
MVVGGYVLLATTSAPQRLLLSTEELAEYLNIPVTTLYRWRGRGTGPRGIRVGRHTRYRVADVESWLDQRADEQREDADAASA